MTTVRKYDNVNGYYSIPRNLSRLKVNILLLVFSIPLITCKPTPTFNDQSVRGYLTERTCWWNEVCKEEFQTEFKCKCPLWSYCRSEGRYYSAYCSITSTGYIWKQPDLTYPIQPRVVPFNRS